MKASEFFPTRFISPLDVAQLGKPRTFTVVTLSIEDVYRKNGPEKVPVVYFSECRKGMVLNKTRNDDLIKMFGDETDDWEGKKVRLMADYINAFGEQVLTIRVLPSNGDEKVRYVHEEIESV